MKRFSGKVAVVTASTDGIGFATAERLASEGAKVVISSRKEHNVNSAVEKLKQKGLDVVGTVCHVAKADDRRKLFELACEKYGGIDILISNAAITLTPEPVLECDEKAWDKIFEINLRSSYLLAKEVLPYLRKRRGGNIVFVSSIAGYQNSSSVLGIYGITKTALFGLTKAAAQDLANENIRVNCVAPGLIDTNMSKPITSIQSAKEMLLMQIPIGRAGTPSEIGSVIAFLVSDDAGYVTGETIVASGGMASRL